MTKNENNTAKNLIYDTENGLENKFHTVKPVLKITSE